MKKPTVIEVTTINRFQVTLDKAYERDEAVLVGHNLISIVGPNPYEWTYAARLVQEVHRGESAATVTGVDKDPVE